MLFLFVPQESWDLQLLMFGYITCGFPRIFGYVLQVIKYSISVPLDRGGFGGWNLMLTYQYKHFRSNRPTMQRGLLWYVKYVCMYVFVASIVIYLAGLG